MRFDLWLLAGLTAISTAHSAAAECFAPGQARQPISITFDTGARVEVIERTSQTLRYKTNVTPAAKPVELETYGGIFTRYADTGTARYEFDWQDDLDKLFPLRVGQKSTATAKIGAGTAAERLFAMTIEVTAADQLRIGNCDYPILKIIQTSGDVGKPTATLTRFFNPDSMLTLRTERAAPATATEPAKTVVSQVIAIE
jgi:hypothetical protein